jgi:adenylate kinase
MSRGWWRWWLRNRLRSPSQPKCSNTYHEKYKPPKKPGVCDFDQSPLFQREDQKEAAVKERIKIYQEQTEPLIKYYQRKNLIRPVDGQQSIEEVSASIMKKMSGPSSPMA